MQIDSLKEKLKSSGYKLTLQREAILEVFLNNVSKLLSAEEIYNQTIKIYKKTNFSTIYRNLEIMENSQIIQKIPGENNLSLYELCDEDHHHHMICKSCGKVESIDFCPLENLKNSLIESDFLLTEHRFELYGYCKNCAYKKKK